MLDLSWLSRQILIPKVNDSAFPVDTEEGKHFCYIGMQSPSADDAQLRMCDTNFPVKQSVFMSSNWAAFRSFKKAPSMPSADIMHIGRSKTHNSLGSGPVELLGT